MVSDEKSGRLRDASGHETPPIARLNKMTKPVKRGRGRPRSPEPKKAVNYRFREIVTKTIHKFKKEGKYSSLDAVVEHTVLHAKDCDRFQPGESDLMFTKEGEVEKIDLSGL